MLWIERKLVAYLALLCEIFEITPDSLRRGRRGNLPSDRDAGMPGR